MKTEIMDLGITRPYEIQICDEPHPDGKHRCEINVAHLTRKEPHKYFYPGSCDGPTWTTRQEHLCDTTE